MAIPQINETVSTYLIYRDIPPGEPFDPTSPLLFFPPKGSDELFDALRIAFPHAKTHSERMRDAIIQYLLEERQQEEQPQQNASPTIATEATPMTWPSMSSESASLLNSPEMLNFGTPATSFATSPQPYAAQLTRQASTTSSGVSPPTLDTMTGVFSVSTSEQPKQRMRRKMTEAEKVEYRKRRIVKACDKCAKRKRKCPHNQAEMESLPTSSSKSSARVTKSTSPRSSKSVTPPSAQQEMIFDPSLMSMNDIAFLNNLDPNTMAPIEDFNMFDDVPTDLDMSQFTFEELLAPSNNFFTPDVSPTSVDWLHDPTQDMQVRNALQSGQGSTDIEHRTSHNRIPNAGSGGEHLPLAVSIPQLTRSGTSLDSSASSDAQSSWEGYGLDSSFLVDEGQHNVGGGDGMLWEHLRTGQIEKPVPTHTAHVHDSESRQVSGLDNRTTPHLIPSTTLPKTVLRLTGTKKAVEAFAGLLNSSSPASDPQTTSLDKVAIALRNTATHAFANESRTGYGLLGSSAGLLASAEYPERHVVVQDSQEQQQSSSVQSGQYASHEESRSEQSTSRASRRVLTLGAALSSSSESSSSRAQARSTSATQAASALLQASPGPVNGRSQRPSQEQYPPAPTLGEGIPETANPSLQLYMSRRRANLNISNKLINANTNAGTSSTAIASGVEPATAKITRGLPGEIARIRNANANATAIANADAHGTIATINANANINANAHANAVQQQQHAKISTSANGGAYLRLEEANANKIKSTRQPSFSDFAGITSALHKQDVRTADIPQDRILKNAHMGEHTTAPTEVPLLSHGQDTRRFRDHHGRQNSPGAFIFAFWFFCFLFALAVAGTPSLFLLSLLRVHEEQEKPEQCTSKNSWWLGGLRFGSWHVLELKMPGRSDCNWFWLDGLMFPHGLAPLRSIFV